LISYFACDYLSEGEINVTLNELKKSRGQNIVFVIDGFDECGDCKVKELIKKLATQCQALCIHSYDHSTVSFNDNSAMYYWDNITTLNFILVLYLVETQ